ncbi:hypothetical protein E308F_27780 [Moorella sp. E308F]|nr:hypothetical protein E308F_27780 [Moorella sp. E308F]
MILEMQKVTEEQIRRSVKKTEPSELQADDVDVYLGSDCDFYAAEGGGRGGSGLYSVDFDLNNNRNLVKVWSVINNSSGWAWTGKVFKVNGTGSQIASFSIEGYYSAYLNFAPDTGAVSIGGVDFKLYDLTEDREVASKSIATFIPPFDGSGQTFTENYSRPNVFQVELKAGHYYRAYLITQGYTVINGIFTSYDLSTNKYSDWYRIQIDF